MLLLFDFRIGEIFEKYAYLTYLYLRGKFRIFLILKIHTRIFNIEKINKFKKLYVRIYLLTRGISLGLFFALLKTYWSKKKKKTNNITRIINTRILINSYWRTRENTHESETKLSDNRDWDAGDTTTVLKSRDDDGERDARSGVA